MPGSALQGKDSFFHFSPAARRGKALHCKAGLCKARQGKDLTEEI